MSFNPEYEKPELDSLKDLVDGLVYRLPGCDLVMIRKTLQEVYRDFCRCSCVLNSVQEIKVRKGDSQIFITPCYGEIDTIVEVYWEDKKLTPNRDYKTSDKSLSVIELDSRLIPTDDKREYSLKALAVEIPSISSERVPRWFLHRYGDAIVSGVLARLTMMTGRAWTDLAQSGIHWNAYENAKNEARNRYYSQSEYANGDLGFAVDNSDLI